LSQNRKDFGFYHFKEFEIVRDIKKRAVPFTWNERALLLMLELRIALLNLRPVGYQEMTTFLLLIS